MAGEAVATELVDHFSKAALADCGALVGNIQLKELPVIGGRVKAGLALDHGLGGHQLHHRALGIGSPCRAVGHRDGVVDIAQKVIDIKMPHFGHVTQALKVVRLYVPSTRQRWDQGNDANNQFSHVFHNRSSSV